jgi:hypothetical protein
MLKGWATKEATYFETLWSFTLEKHLHFAWRLLSSPASRVPYPERFPPFSPLWKQALSDEGFFLERAIGIWQ